MLSDRPPIPEAAPPFVRPEPLSLSFNGFPQEGLDALARLRAEPHIEQYRTDKAVLDRAVLEPFARYRDDLVVNWVIPNGLPFETERNVFSRLLKNDFGRGGAHSHLWMSFYRPPRKRLTDLQLSHAVHPDRFRWGLYIGDYAKGLFGPAHARLLHDPEGLEIVNDLLGRGYRLAFAPRVSKPEGHPEITAPIRALPDGLDRAKGLWLMKALPIDEVKALGSGLVARAIDAQEALWPLYRFLAEAPALADRSAFSGDLPLTADR